jgi:hypothetical protein
MAEGGSETTTTEAGVGHNRPEVIWERWVKKRTFVRALEGTYGEMKQGIYDQPRVFSIHDFEWKLPNPSKHISAPSRPVVSVSGTAT